MDTLLDFRPQLSEEECAGYAARAAALAEAEGAEAAMDYMEKALREYPENPMLSFHLASILSGVLASQPGAVDRAKALYRQVCDGGEPRYASSAIFMLASLCIGEARFEEAEALLDRLPAPEPDASLLRIRLLEEKGDIEGARKQLQSQLYMAFSKLETCIAKLAAEPFTPDGAQALSLCRLHRDLAERIGCASTLSDSLFMEVYIRLREYGRAAAHLLSLARFLGQGGAMFSTPLLFCTLAKDGEGESRRQFCRIACKALEEDESLGVLREERDFQAALELLQKSCQ